MAYVNADAYVMCVGNYLGVKVGNVPELVVELTERVLKRGRLNKRNP
jgi:hypothetical protein